MARVSRSGCLDGSPRWPGFYPGFTHTIQRRAPKAITAAAHKLARLIYTMLTKGEDYTDQGQDYYEKRYRDHVVQNLSQRAAKLGMKMVPLEEAVP